MTWLLDTCVLSELQRPEPDAAVVRWVAEQAAETLHVSVLSVAEMHGGVLRMDRGHRRSRSADWLQEIRHAYDRRTLPVDGETADLWQELRLAARAQGVQVPVVDGLIAATAARHGLTVVTRNTDDFAAAGVETFNPWPAAPAAPPAGGSA